MLAPTEILARQHFDTITRQLAGLPVTVAILTGRDKGRVRESTLMGLADGSIDILIGTHAIFQEAVAYKRLGLAVIDEQHRFGVAQRLLLTQKAEKPPHLLVMTATPIPRTLTLSNYGEMDVSRLDEMPPGRQPIDTRVMSGDRLDEVVEGLSRHIGRGGQAYWVCPLVEENEDSDRAAAEAVVSATLEREQERIAFWIRHDKESLALDYRGESGRTIGAVLLRGESRMRPASASRRRSRASRSTSPERTEVEMRSPRAKRKSA
jgi:ATP-dependent DNA helicase RecG